MGKHKKKNKEVIPGVYVYIWDFKIRPFAFGHASLKVINSGSQQVYISWWPMKDRYGKKRSKNIYFAYPERDQTHQDDVYLEEHQPDHTIFIPGKKTGEQGLNIIDIIKFWETLSLKSNGVQKSGPLLPWHTFKLNCSTVVFEALKAGGALTYASESRWLSIPWNPNSVKEFALSVKHNIEKARINDKQLAT
ncbi:hypothetical protein [Salmonella bongori]|uniref:DUF4105 domain-containing protein n=3 Tax=Salmonella TaxID=590 RepID=A0A750KIV9_SALER|nr:hypothetical protein [Salmonella bongori]EGE4660677.1 hypothetical protein [Salmonella bongori serovar 48:i:- str. 94-0708]EGS1130457.1 hypothetical protein [Salmonella bongori CFSAN000509]HAC6694716.1 hypothetical protein [Salmonella bongori serovar 44:r:-]AID27138.1 hypothetical protein N643_05940 [Salmonella bongori serovar 48:z41:-- str. RKS3044]ECG1191861.1 hypothetical protein [Salmonella bongori]